MKSYKTIVQCIGLVAVCILASCTQVTETIFVPVSSEAEVRAPTITSISEDVSTVINVRKTISVGASPYFQDDELAYQWYAADSKLAEGTAIEGAEEASYSPATAETGTFYYYCTVTGRNGDSVTSPRITYAVSDCLTATAPRIAAQPRNVTADFGAEFSLSVIAYSTDGGTLSYQWYFSASEDVEATAIEGASESGYKGTVGSDTLGFYYCVVTNTIEDNGDGGEKSATALTNRAIISTDTVNANTPTILAQSEDATVLVPAIKVLSVAAYADDGDVSYQWYTVQDGESGGTAIENETNATLKIRTEQLGRTGYYCVVTNTIEDNGDGGKKVAEITSATIWIDAVYLKDVVSAPEFTEQPASMSVAPFNQSIKISCEAESTSGSVSYRWYESADGTSATGTAISGETSATLTTPVFTEKGVRYFYCVATVILSADDGEDIKSAAAISNVVSVACTGLPAVQIDTVDGEEPTADYVGSPQGCYGAGLKNTTKVPSRMRIFKFGENSAIYDSGEYIKKESGLTIKLRGNTSAYGAKKPYKLKLQKKADLLSEICHSGDTARADSKYKSKDWILLKDGTSLNTFVGLAVADIAGTSWTPEFAYVNVVLNNEYRGVYMLIEAISQSEKRVDVADDGYIIERDAYWWNEDVKFITGLNQKYTFKYPDEDDITEEQIAFIKDYMESVETHVQDGTYEDYIDTGSFARWQLIHDMLGSWDSGGSNIYMSKYDSSTPENPYADGTWSKITMSTPWDFDSNYMMTNDWSNVHKGNRIYSQLLFSSENTAFLDSYKAQWTALSASLTASLSSKLSVLKAELGEDINASRQLDATKWGTTYNTVEENITTAENWFSSRTIWLDTAINGL